MERKRSAVDWTIVRDTRFRQRQQPLLRCALWTAAPGGRAVIVLVRQSCSDGGGAEFMSELQKGADHGGVAEVEGCRHVLRGPVGDRHTREVGEAVAEVGERAGDPLGAAHGDRYLEPGRTRVVD